MSGDACVTKWQLSRHIATQYGASSAIIGDILCVPVDEFLRQIVPGRGTFTPATW